MSEFNVDFQKVLAENLDSGKTVPILITRGEQIIRVDWVIPGPDQKQLVQRINGIWWLSYVFWMAGTATLLFIRPRDNRWKLLIAFNYLTAIWLGAGSGPSHWHIWNSGLILNSTLWLCLPVYLHLHWEFPKPFMKIPRAIWIVLYILSISFAVGQWFQLLPQNAFYVGFVIAVLGSVVLLVLHGIVQKQNRKDIGFLGSAVALTMLPSVGVALVSALGITPPSFITGGAFLALPALPGAYFLVIYRRQFQLIEKRIRRLTRIYLVIVLGGIAIMLLLTLSDMKGTLSNSTIITGIGVSLMSIVSAITGFSPFLALPALLGEKISIGHDISEVEIRANRILALFLFIILMIGILAAGVTTANFLFQFPGDSIVLAVGASLIACLITAIGFAPFQSIVDRVIFGVTLPFEDILIQYSHRITTSLDSKRLVTLLKNELLPSLLIRQSVLLQIDSGTVKPFLVLGIDEPRIPAVSDISNLQNCANRFLFSPETSIQDYPWIRLVIPLKVDEDYVGFWLFGRRDPDDYYSQPEVKLLNSLVNQTAIALTNIEQAKRLHTFYQSNIDWHEEERKVLARELHDEVLGQMASLSMSAAPPDSPEFLEHFSRVTNSIRQMITLLRPAMLEYGLWTALDEFIDGINEKTANQATLRLELPKSHLRYDTKIEEHLYRIVQQACENALRHANADTIIVYGNLEQNRVNLVVEDNGIGLKFDHLDISDLLARRHFGLAGMSERAALIGGNLNIAPGPEKGTRVIIYWDSE